jgi:hypothetical protein
MMKIEEPKKQSEFEVQAYLWFSLRNLGINARGEVKVKFPDGGKRSRCRFDVAIFEDGFLSGILEVKASVTKHKSERGWLGTRQGVRYNSFGVPVRIIYGQMQAESFVEEVKQHGAIQW